MTRRAASPLVDEARTFAVADRERRQRDPAERERIRLWKEAHQYCQTPGCLTVIDADGPAICVDCAIREARNEAPPCVDCKEPRIGAPEGWTLCFRCAVGSLAHLFRTNGEPGTDAQSVALAEKELAPQYGIAEVVS